MLNLVVIQHASKSNGYAHVEIVCQQDIDGNHLH